MNKKLKICLILNEQDGVNKRFLEAQLHDYLKTNGQNPVTFDLNMNNYKMINLRDTTGSIFDSEADGWNCGDDW